MTEICGVSEFQFGTIAGEAYAYTSTPPCTNTVPCPRHTKVTVTLARLKEAMRQTDEEAHRLYDEGGQREDWDASSDNNFIRLLFGKLAKPTAQ